MNSVLLISADSDFIQTVIARWQSERTVPAFVTLADAPAVDAVLSACEMAIVGPAPLEPLSAILRSLDAAARPVLCLAPDSATASNLRQAFPKVLVLREHEGWPDSLLVLALEVLRRVDAANRARRAEQGLALAQQNATLGKYMLDMRHSLNNALTSVLGNAELLLLEPGSLPEDQRDQISTVHTMALRIHEVIQRFSSLEQEMKLFSSSQPEIPLPPKASVVLHGRGLS